MSNENRFSSTNKSTWERLVEEYGHLIDKQFVRYNPYGESDGVKHTFFGLVHGSDDYYFGMISSLGKTSLLSCCGSIESHGFELTGE